jgi:hypothetical protein
MTLRLLVLLSILFQIACAHVQRYDLNTADVPVAPFSEVQAGMTDDKSEIVVRAPLELQAGAEFQVPAAPFVIRYKDGSTVKVDPVVYSQQDRIPVEQKFSESEGYRISHTKDPEVWEVQKVNKVVYNVVVDASVSYYDQRPKVDGLEIGKRYEFAHAEDAYAERKVFVEIALPNRRMDFEVEGFKVTVDSIPYPEKLLRYEYISHLEKVDLL